MALTKPAGVAIQLIALLIFISLPLSVSAGAAFDLFGDGLFGAAWGDTVAQTKAHKPGGEQKDLNGNVVYSTNDPRTILGIDRTDTPTIAYAFDPQRGLFHVAVEFPGDEESRQRFIGKLHNLFGEPSVGSIGEATNMIFKYPMDNTIKVMANVNISVGLFSQSTSADVKLLITKYADQITQQDKDAMGFN